MAYKKIGAYLLVGLTTVALCYLYVKLFWIWVFLALTICLVLTAVFVQNQTARLILVNLVAIPASLLLAESYYRFGFSDVAPVSGGTLAADSYYQDDSVLGYSPEPNSVRTSSRSIGETEIYDVTYTINDLGLRTTPSSDATSENCILFFGGSFTFGEGVEDAETVANLINAQHGSAYRVFNYGFHGYGPHHMLAALQNDVVAEDIQGCRETTAVYTGLMDHVYRAAGKVPWDRNGPKYVVAADGSLVRQGTFSTDPAERVERLFRSAVNQSALFRRLIAGRPTQYTAEDIAIYVGIIEESYETAQTLDSISRFVVVFWDAPTTSDATNIENSAAIIQDLEAKEIEFYLISDFLDGYAPDPIQYQLNESDMHPNLTANEMISLQLSERIFPED